MLGSSPFVSPTVTAVSGLVTRLREWPVASQQQARRNAMVAATACAQRRSERDDVADFIAHLDEPEKHAAEVTGAASPPPSGVAHG
ncbi:MAG: hypothetical protein WB767_07390 [Nocardioides sp.]